MNVIGLIKEIGIKLGNQSFLPRLGSSLIRIPHRFQYRGSNNGSINVAETGIRLVHLVETFFAHFAILSNKAGRTVAYHEAVANCEPIMILI